MSTYPKYPEYKESGIAWLGKVPNHWSVKRIKNIASYNDEALDEKTDPDFELEYVDISSVSLVEGIENTELMTFEKSPSRARRKVKHGDTIVSTVRTYLKAIAAIKHPPMNMIVSTGFAVIRPFSKLNPDFVGYLLQADGFVGDVVANSVGVSYPAINASVLATLPAIEPLAEEQAAIARFLDFKTAQIDALIAKKEMLLARLAEKRTALISHAVTKGLDPTVPMKDSCVAWLGDIPAHWAMKRLRFCMHTNPSKSEIQLADDALVSFVPMDAVGEFGGLRLGSEKELSEIVGGYTYFTDGDVVVAKITPCFENGKGAIARDLANGVAFGTTELHVLRASESLLPEYLFHVTMSYPFRMIGESEMYGAGGQKRVPESFLKDFKVGLPPVNEQHDIVNYINEKHRQLGNQLSKAGAAIEKLKEYRAALITNAVTGKIDVRNVEVPKMNSETA